MGYTDVIAGENRSDAAASWFDGIPPQQVTALAEQLSPLRYVREGLPPIMTVQGDNDQVVPYAHGVALHEALDDTRVQHQLLTVPGGGHGLVGWNSVPARSLAGWCEAAAPEPARPGLQHPPRGHRRLDRGR